MSKLSILMVLILAFCAGGSFFTGDLLSCFICMFILQSWHTDMKIEELTSMLKKLDEEIKES